MRFYLKPACQGSHNQGLVSGECEADGNDGSIWAQPDKDLDDEAADAATPEVLILDWVSDDSWAEAQPGAVAGAQWGTTRSESVARLSFLSALIMKVTDFGTDFNVFN